MGDVEIKGLEVGLKFNPKAQRALTAKSTEKQKKERRLGALR
jgi:hypothetical protein